MYTRYVKATYVREFRCPQGPRLVARKIRFDTPASQKYVEKSE